MEKDDPPPSYNSVVQAELRRRIKTPKDGENTEGNSETIPTSTASITTNATTTTNSKSMTNTNEDNDDVAPPSIGDNTHNAEDADDQSSDQPSAPPSSDIQGEKNIEPSVGTDDSEPTTNGDELIECPKLTLWERLKKGLEDFAFFVIQLLD